MIEEIRDINDYDYSDEDEEFEDNELEKQLDLYAPSIGRLVMSFNSLEETVNSCLVEEVRNHDDGIGNIIISKMSYSAKVDLLKSLYTYIIHMCGSKRFLARLEPLFQGLVESGTDRNSILHGAWDELNKNSEIKFKTIVHPDGPKHKYRKVTVEMIDKMSQDFYDLSEKLFEFHEDFGQGVGTDDSKV